MKDNLNNFDFSMSTEAYFGKDNPLTVGFIKGIGEARVVLQKHYDLTDLNDKDNKRALKGKESEKIRVIFERLQKLAEREFNVEQVSLGIIPNENAHAYPMYVNSRLRDPKTMAAEIKSLNEMEQGKKSFRFRTKTGKVIIVAVGLGLLINPKYSVESVVAIIFHEFGHNFQHIMNGIKRNVYVSTFDDGRDKLYKPFMTIYNISKKIVGDKNALLMTSTLYKGAMLKHKNDNNDNDYFNEMIRSEGGTSINRETTGDSYEDTALGRSLRNLMFIKKSQDLTDTLMIIINSILLPLTLMNVVITMVIGTLTMGLQQLVISNKKGKFLEKQENEGFADYFPVVYGLGEAFSKAAVVMGKYNRKFKYGIHSYWIYYVPGVNVVLYFEEMLTQNTIAMIYGYPKTSERVSSSYKILEHELSKNGKDMNPEIRAEIEVEMKNISRSYDKYKKDPIPYNTIDMILSVLFNVNIKQQKTPVTTRVLAVMDKIEKQEIKNGAILDLSKIDMNKTAAAFSFKSLSDNIGSEIMKLINKVKKVTYK